MEEILNAFNAIVDRRDHEFQQGLVRHVMRWASYEIGKLPPAERAGWIVYLLEIMDGAEPGGEALLAAVREEIGARLASGGW